MKKRIPHRLRNRLERGGLFRRKERRGALVILLVFMVGVAANTITVKFVSDSQDRYAATENSAMGYRATMLAQAGLQAGITAIKTVPEEYLYKTGLMVNPPDLPVEGCRPRCFITYRIQPEDGKLNVNYLVRAVDDEPDEQYRAIFERLFTRFDIPLDILDSTIDWIDTNNYREGRGAESDYYRSLNPPRKIKNYQMFNLSELGMVKGMTREMLYGSRAPEQWLRDQKELESQSEDEKNLITKDDWILANNTTAYLTDPGGGGDDRINLNAARYHVLLSLSDSMTKEAVQALFKLKKKNGYFLKDVSLLKDLPEFQRTTANGITLYEELAGSGGKTGILKTEGRIYRIVGVGSIFPLSDKNNRQPVVRRVNVLYDKMQKKIIYYDEE